MAGAKYKAKDKILYYDTYRNVVEGTVEKVMQTDIHEWSPESKYLYQISHYPYFRYEEEIIGIYVEE